jgi:hypothetical protein
MDHAPRGLDISSNDTASGATAAGASTKPNSATDDAPSDLKAIGLLELFETDERPVLIYDLRSPTNEIPVYYNPQLQKLHDEGSQLVGKSGGSVLETATGGEHAHFKKWIFAVPGSGTVPSAIYCGIKWTNQTLRNRWRIIAGEVGSQPVDSTDFPRPERVERPRLDRSQTTAQTPTPSRYRPVSKRQTPQDPVSVEAQLEAFTPHRGESISLFPTAQETKVRATMPPGSYDILLGNPLVEQSAHIQFFLAFDWASTELGPTESWSLGLRRMANILLADPRPAAMFWGKNRIMLYNEPYVIVTGDKHPFMMGKPFLVAWAEIADSFAPAFNKGYETGIATTMDDALFYIDRHGYLEETYYAISMIPFGTSEGHMAL